MSGSRGPLPKPAALRLLEGNASKRALDLSAGVNPTIAVPDAPRHLGREARKEWKRITPLLEELGLISGLDRAALALYCQTAGRLAELETSFNRKVDQRVKDGMDYSDAVYEVSHAITPSGYAQQSVLVQLISRNREQLHRYLQHFGLSPAARGRVQASNNQQIGLPGIEPKPEAPAGFAKFSVVN
ncbi:phage terminase small subunit P27 family [Ottowia sp. GY511]|uniref:Phage terminase small subunit P27 family n=1 Tax=Ottowia flava TaxID=2675430 RepID=A0ABW4KLS1_9BURK|nr:phage terminase small subunit P27 family [Ottowia sp. GY511]TXK26379.1 phage terminase small subunit P27 family [Ottowia sp. GY511]